MCESYFFVCVWLWISSDYFVCISRYLSSSPCRSLTDQYFLSLRCIHIFIWRLQILIGGCLYIINIRWTRCHIILFLCLSTQLLFRVAYFLIKHWILISAYVCKVRPHWEVSESAECYSHRVQRLCLQWTLTNAMSVTEQKLRHKLWSYTCNCIKHNHVCVLLSNSHCLQQLAGL